MTLVMNSQREVCAITKAGGAIPTDKIIMCSRIAIVKAEHLTKILKDALANANGHSESKRK